MNEDAVRNWILKAEGDLKVGRDEMNTEAPVTDAVCFHMQQCCEKYLKAFLIFHGAEAPKTHNLAALVNRCEKFESDFRTLLESGIDQLTDFAVEVRYGEEFYIPPAEEAQQAVIMAETVRNFVLKKFEERGFKPSCGGTAIGTGRGSGGGDCG